MAESTIEVDRFPVVVYIFSHIGHQAGIRGQFSNLGGKVLEMLNSCAAFFSLLDYGWLASNHPCKRG